MRVMILTRKQGVKRLPALIAMALAVPLLSVPAWGQNEGAAKPAADAPVAAATTTAHATAEPGLFWMPEAISTYGEGVDDLFWLIFWITGIAFVVVEGLMLWFLFRYRNREGHDTAHYTHGSNKLEVTWTLVTVVILVLIGIAQLMGESSWLKIKTEYPELEDGTIKPDTFVVRVYGEQFAWHFNYPGKDAKFEEQRHYWKTPGKIGLNEEGNDKVLPKLVVPKNANVLIQLISLGKFVSESKKYDHPVLHSFFSPNLRLKQDLVPYHPGKIWFKVKKDIKKNKFEIVCAELCGEGHSNMHASFEVMSDDELEKTLGYDWKTAVPKKFPEVIHHYQEPSDPEEEE